jgi:hypothetical protein
MRVANPWPLANVEERGRPEVQSHGRPAGIEFAIIGQKETMRQQVRSLRALTCVHRLVVRDAPSVIQQLA